MDSKDSLIDRIEEVKKKIAEFESTLNITAVDINKITIDRNGELMKQIADYKQRINNIETDVVQEKAKYPIEEMPLLSNRHAEGNAAQTKTAADNSYTNIKKTIEKVEMEKKEVENIDTLLEKLKKNVAVQKNAGAALKKDTASNEIKIVTPVVPLEENGPFDYAKPSAAKPTAVNPVEIRHAEVENASVHDVKITENDLHSMSELISKLDELLRSNKDIADKLNELLKEQKVDNGSTSKSSELIKKLAILGSKGSLN